ncbi:hypothetical protein [uncultured Sphingomonas sp.]|uniref:hypothetical protein n=1 Tax=uncultured Sphingomonas sp. TaxID=158754 RepID=UPI0035C96620
MDQLTSTTVRGPGHPLRRRVAAFAEPSRRSDETDLKLFALSFTAFFICIYTLIC